VLLEFPAEGLIEQKLPTLHLPRLGLEEKTASLPLR
jgi:hypothetical protein